MVQRQHLRVVRRQFDAPRPGRGRWRALLAAGIAGLAILGAGMAYRFLRPAPASTVVLTHGKAEITLLTDALVIRNEQVYTAPVAGKVRRLVPDGRRVRVGAPVVRIGTGEGGGVAAAPAASAPVREGEQRSALGRSVDELSARIFQLALAVNQARAKGESDVATRLQDELDQAAARQWELSRQLSRTEPPAPETAAAAARPQEPGSGTNVMAEMSGVLVYQTDGLEAALRPAAAGEWKPSWFRSLPLPALKATADEVAAGAPVFKVVDSLSLSLLAVVPADLLPSLPADGRIEVRFAGQQAAVTVRITRRVQEGDQVLLQLSAPVLPEELAERRKVQVSLLLAEHAGKVVPRSAIDVRDGKQGVWVQEGRGDPFFHPVRVTGGNERDVVLETNLTPGTLILREAPSHMR